MSIFNEMDLIKNRFDNAILKMSDHAHTRGCNECGKQYTSKPRHDNGDADVEEIQNCDTIEGQYIEWVEVKCPNCGYVQDI